ncbi:MAG TPA: hypothetical protein VGK45_04235, partial [Thermoanaerobaculia bacterium]
MGHPVSPPIELTAGQMVVTGDQGDGVRRAIDLGLDEPVQESRLTGAGRGGGSGTGRLDEHLLPLPGEGDRQLLNRQGRIVYRSPEKGGEAGQEALHR